MGNSVMLNGVEYAGEQIAYKDSTYELVSKVAYLIGVPLRIFQNEHEPPKIEIYNRLEQDKNARIIRNLWAAAALRRTSAQRPVRSPRRRLPPPSAAPRRTSASCDAGRKRGFTISRLPRFLPR